MLKISIHQPGYLPWIGFFDKIACSDIFVLLDNVQYQKNYFDNRNKIKTKKGWIWLTVPVKYRFGQKLNEVEIENNIKWPEKHYKTLITNYSRAPYFSEYFSFFDEIYNKRKWKNLIDLNLTLINYIKEKMGIKTKLKRSSEFKTAGEKGDRILEICQKLKADFYLSGKFGRNYLDEKKFEEKNIKVDYQEFEHPVYPQIFGDFIPGLSAIDLLFNCGPESRKYLYNYEK